MAVSRIFNNSASTSPTSGTRALPLARLSGWAGIIFVLIVLGQNVIRMAISPANDAPVESIINHYQADRSLYVLLGSSFAASGVALAFFVAGITTAAKRESARIWARIGLLGGASIMALFAVMVACEFSLLVATDRPIPTPAVVETLWILHNGTFAVLSTMIAIAMIGVSRAAVAEHLIPGVLGRIGLAGAALLAVGTVAGPQIAAGDLQPLAGVAGIGFLVWLSVVVGTSIGLMRSTSGVQ